LALFEADYRGRAAARQLKGLAAPGFREVLNLDAVMEATFRFRD
jgi:hypothetical protein